MAVSTELALIVFAWGNISRGDDGIGPLLAESLRSLGIPALSIIEDHQLNIEHVMDFNGDTPLLFIDASIAIDRGYRLERIEPTVDGNFSTHAISPQALLNVYQKSTGADAPEAFLLHVAGKQFGLGESLGETANDAVDAARNFLTRVLSSPTHEWREKLTVDLNRPDIS